jgi:hypothetical protein
VRFSVVSSLSQASHSPAAPLDLNQRPPAARALHGPSSVLGALEVLETS